MCALLVFNNVSDMIGVKQHYFVVLLLVFQHVFNLKSYFVDIPFFLALLRNLQLKQ